MRINPYVYPGLNINRHTLDGILEAVSQASGVSMEAIRGDCRTRNYVIPRQVYCYIAKKKTNYSHVQIGALLGGYNHASVTHSIGEVIEKLNIRDRPVTDLVKKVEGLFFG